MKLLETLERFKQPQMLADMDWNNRVEIIEKALKALEIIKNRKVDIFLIYRFSTADRYNDYLGRGTLWRDRLLTQEEYDLLKEILEK